MGPQYGLTRVCLIELFLLVHVHVYVHDLLKSADLRLGTFAACFLYNTDFYGFSDTNRRFL